MAQEIKRVYHPTLNTYKDVPVSDVASWAEAGWRKTAPAHFDPSQAPRLDEPSEPKK